jgi:class 3 adenylate cyclase
MGLRYRLFLWVSGLFVVIAATSYFLENKVTARELAKAKIAMKQEILSISESRRVSLQDFIAESIAENLVRIDAILSNILQYAPVALRFSPLSINEKRGTWGESADLLLEYKWIDFLQNTAENQVVALIAPQQTSVDITYQVPIDEELFWVYFKPESKAYLGIKIPYFLSEAPDGGKERLEKVPGEIPIVLFIFDLEKLEASSLEVSSTPPWKSIPIKWTEGYALDVETFATSFQKAKQKLLRHELIPPVLSQEEIALKISEQEARKPPLLSPAFLSSLPQEELMKRRLTDIALDYTQMNLIWIWMALFEEGVFGQDLFKFPAPLAVGMLSEGHPMGFGIQANKALFSSPLFKDSDYYQSHSPKTQGSGLSTGFAVIPSAKRLFLGNTAQFVVDVDGEERSGYLTLGIDANILLERLVLALNQTVMLVHDNKIFGAYLSNGEPLAIPQDLPLEQMQQAASGLIPWQGSEYFYLHLQPFPEADLHLLLLNTEAKEFALLHDLESGSQRVADAILFNIHIAGVIALFIVIIVLHNISRKITEPIVELAEATEHVATGRFDQIHLKTIISKHKDEVAQLYHAFCKMISGLQEKEKMKAVLNKVVSSEIAQEILAGNVHLGGEEKTVSVLFADIRGFTNMTQHLPAKQVIEMLNVCMTKLSLLVDENKGVIDKYVGDEVMALFGAPLTRERDSLHAVTSAIAMIRAMHAWNAERSSRGEVPIEIGIGIHTGTMLAGNMGAENRLNYTVIGRNVNLAARLCSAAKPMEILISHATWEEVKDHIRSEELPPLTLKGFDTPIPVYRVM